MPEELTPIEAQIVQEWQAAQVGQRHIGEAIDRMFEAWRRDRQRILELEEQVAVLVARVAELMPE